MTHTRILRRHWVLNRIENGLAYAQKFGEDVVPGFVIDEENRDTITRLIRYFHGDPAFSPDDRYEGDLTKGILLMGIPGSGKSVLMSLFTRYVAYDDMFFIAEGKQCKMQFPIMPANQVVKHYELMGNDYLELYSRRRIVCFEDLGEEPKESLHF